MWRNSSSQSALLTMTASVARLPNCRNLAKTWRIPAMLRAICSSDKSWRDSSFPEGSPIFVVPPPINTIGLLPVFWNQRSSMIDMRLPICRLSAVQS